MVNQGGERYLNEAASYHIVGQQMARRQREKGDAEPSWMIFDHRYRHQFPMGPLYPLMPDWLHRGEVRSILRKSASVEGLAEDDLGAGGAVRQRRDPDAALWQDGRRGDHRVAAAGQGDRPVDGGDVF